jgi:hypothetical protein
MHANELALGRNMHTADAAKIVHGPDWHRWHLMWADGAEVQCCEDTPEEAFEALRRYGFYLTPASES